VNEPVKSNAIRPKERDAIIRALAAGVVPRIGLPHIQVGRAKELQALIKDIDRIADEGATVRFVIGEYGSGKTFFLNLVRLIALERRLLVVNADLAPERRLHATGGQARMLYAELMRNMATRTRPEGGALASVVERFVSEAAKAARQNDRAPAEEIRHRLRPIEELVSGFDFSAVLSRYQEASESAEESTKGACLRWLRAEFPTKTEARQSIDVRSIIDDASVYDYLKVLARFSRLAGYAGLLICVDEMVNLYKLQSKQARDSNYEQILRIVNDVLQGSAAAVGFVFGGTPEFLSDTRRGLFSYAALQSRLAENTFARDGLVDLSGPVLRLASLSQEDLYVLLTNIRNVFAAGNPSSYLVPDAALQQFMTHCFERVGDAYFRTPRNTVKAFVQFLSVLEQNPGAKWEDMLGAVGLDSDKGADLEKAIPTADAEGGATASAGKDDDLTSFKL
jgi:hypothetical protein